MGIKNEFFDFSHLIVALIRLVSTAVVQLLCKHQVVGSIPTQGSIWVLVLVARLYKEIYRYK